MKLIEIKKADKDGTLPIALNTAYKWRSLSKYPKLLVKVTGKVYFDFDEWEEMAKKAVDRQVKKTERIYSTN